MSYLEDLIGKRGVPFVVKYQPHFHNPCAIIRKYFTFLYAKEDTLRVSTWVSFVSFCSG